MMARLTDIWRHPIKSHGREALKSVTLESGRTMPFDRVWAVAHEAAKLNTDAPEWARCANFARGAKAPQLMAIDAQIDEATGVVHLRHPSAGEFAFDPNDPDDAAKFIDWVTPLNPADRAQPAQIYKVAGRGMTDSDFPSVSIASHGSLRALSDRMGGGVDARRFRCNFWLDDGLAPWEEFGWIGKEFRIGEVTFRGVERIERCTATMANPDTGARDIDPLAALEDGWGHKDLGIRAEVVTGGMLRLGDMLEL